MNDGGPAADRYVILDTDAFSFLLARRPEATNYGSVLRNKVPALTFVALAELRFGALNAGWGERRVTELEQSIRKCVVLPFDEALTSLWARIKRDATSNGHPLAQRENTNDLWVAACGIYYGAPVLTGNTRHFSGVAGLHVIDGSG